MKYIVSYDNPFSHFIEIEYIIPENKQDLLTVQLPAWRPGRYELGNFAKNIQKWGAFDESGKKLKFRKVTKDSWEIETKGCSTVHIRYNYFATEINAGSSYLDKDQLYVNPVNCFLYVPERIHELCKVDLSLPASYEIATSLKSTSKHSLIASDFHELADSPFIASNSLKHFQFVMDGIEFNLWFQGECAPNGPKLVNDFFIFINEQLLMMREFTTDEYHFLFQILPYKFYHGVEHVKSTVIALGPSYSLMQGELYDELLGISSHELFHSWNVKTIRPVELMPYDYSQENYSRLGYVAEGVTTYYGDLLLYRSGVFSDVDYMKTVNANLQKHFDNFGRFNLSVAESSFDTWLDGYVPGIPNRKTSIYTEGAIVAFMSDMIIRKETGNDFSLDDVMRVLYNDFAKQSKGYSEEEYKIILEKVSGINFDEFFQNFIWGTKNYEQQLKDCLSYIGFSLSSSVSRRWYESHYGFKVIEEKGIYKVSHIIPASVADKAGISIGDQIIAVNGMEVNQNLNEWVKYFIKDAGKPIDFTLFSSSRLKVVSLKYSSKLYYPNYFVTKIKQPTSAQIEAFEKWSKRKF